MLHIPKSSSQQSSKSSDRSTGAGQQSPPEALLHCATRSTSTTPTLWSASVSSTLNRSKRRKRSTDRVYLIVAERETGAEAQHRRHQVQRLRAGRTFSRDSWLDVSRVATRVMGHP